MKQLLLRTIWNCLPATMMCICFFEVNAQLTVNNTGYTVDQLVNGVLVPSGSGTIVSNVTFKGVYNVSSRYQIGYFSNTGTTASEMGFSNGVVLSTGNTADIPLTTGTNPGSVAQMSRNYVSGTSGEIRSSNAASGQDADVAVLIAPESYYNAVVLEFDFVPLSDAVQFRYIFGSEEYNDQSGSAFAINYNCSSYNDQFAMLLSGPGISGGQGYSSDARNISRLPNNAEVGINSVNDGLVGSSGGAPNASNCLAANPAWSNGSPTAQFLGFIDGTELNGNTRILVAYQNGLTPGQTYHLKIILADSNDGAYDSVVYLEGSSFTTQPNSLPVELTMFDGACDAENGVQLQWRTETERSNDYFVIERADASLNFVPLDTVKGMGTDTEPAEYLYTDKSAWSGINYYRLRQVDYDGKAEIHPEIAVDASCVVLNPYGFAIGLNPEQQYVNVWYDVNRPVEISLELIAATGEILYTEKVTCEPESNRLYIPAPRNPGIYLVRIANEEMTYTGKLFRH